MDQAPVEHLASLLLQDRRLISLKQTLSKSFPTCFPLDGNRLREGVPFLLLVRLHTEANALGLGSLPAPGLLLLWLLRSDVPLPHPDPDRLGDEVGWFYQRFALRLSLVQIADRATFSESTVSQGLTRVRKLLDVGASRGRPRYWHYAARSL